MRLAKLALCLALWSLAVACSPQSKAVLLPRVGEKDAQGRLVFHIYEGSNPKVVSLESDIGIMMFRRGGWPVFLLADRRAGKVTEFTSYETFLESLSELPEKSKITIYDRCTVPLFYDFYPVHFKLREKFSEFCKSKGLILVEDPQITCTCTIDLPASFKP